MMLYEIRILRPDRTTGFCIEAMHLNDNSALRYAQHVAGDRQFEVWRDLDRVYEPGAERFRA